MTRVFPLLLGFALVATCFLTPQPAVAQDRTADQILADYEAIEFPTYDRSKRTDREYQAAYRKQRQEAVERQCDLILELYKSHPKHDRVAELLPQRWANLSRPASRNRDLYNTLVAEVEAATKTHSEGILATEGLHARAQLFMLGIGSEFVTREQLAEAVDAFVGHAPGDKRAPRLLVTVAQRHTPEDQQVAAYERVLAAYPGDRAVRYVPGKIRQVKEMGKPFKLEFTDPISGQRVSTERLKGKVLVIDFWATWCGPCIAEMPHMKELYAKYKDKGVEFIGVSLDQPDYKGGLDRLKKYCAENEIAWPQYYQGNYWTSDFSMAWGINSIPSMFVIDAEGNLHSTSARGKLSEMIPELLGEKTAGGDDAEG